jgi:hypothetical protein
MRTLAVLILLLFATAAAAQLRSIPANAKRAQMSHVSQNRVEINGEPAQLSPGAQIRDPLNRIITPATLPPDSAVKYQLDGTGLVHRVWILSPEEANRPEPQQ